MDEEKMQRQMEFIVEWQAQFAAKLGQIEDNLARQGEAIERQGENIERQGENIGRLTGVVEQVVDGIARLAQLTLERFEAVDRRADETDRKIAALVDAQIRTEDRVADNDRWARESAADFDRRIKESAADFDRRLALLLDSQKQTEEALRNLAATVDRHIAEGRNGKAGAEG
ncbi:MAG TPA: hypothetical protein VF659_03020 [Pyrinomonadaceae bacterium]|jgi:archaellum component FlaC